MAHAQTTTQLRGTSLLARLTRALHMAALRFEAHRSLTQIDALSPHLQRDIGVDTRDIKTELELRLLRASRTS
ncbi:MAG: hypothetical protein AAF618_09535 [Pseudomonadota bacterium]